MSRTAKLVGEQIRHVRAVRGLSMERLAEMASLSVGFLSEIERGRKAPGLDTLQSLAQALGVQLTDLVAPLVLDAPRVVHKFQLLGRLESVMREVYTEAEAAKIVAEVQASDST